MGKNNLTNHNINKRSLDNPNDLTEVLNIIAGVIPKYNTTIEEMLKWYMVKKSRASKIQIKDGIVKEYCDRMDKGISIIKNLPTDMDQYSESKHFIVNCLRDLFGYISESNKDTVVAFMYAYYVKANIVSSLELLSWEPANSLESISTMAILICQVLKNIDKEVYLNKEKFPNIPKPTAPVISKPIPNVPKIPSVEKNTVQSSSNVKNIVKVNKDKEEKNKPTKLLDDSIDYIGRNAVVKKAGARCAKKGKGDITIDALSLYNDFASKEYTHKELEILYDISLSTIKRILAKFIIDNNLPSLFDKNGLTYITKEIQNYAKYRTDKKSGSNRIPIKKPNRKERRATEKASKNTNVENDIKTIVQEDDDERLFEIAQMKNNQDINNIRSTNMANRQSSIKKIENRKFENFPVTYNIDSNIKLEVSERNKKNIDKNGGGFCKLNDGKFYFVTPNDYLIFRNRPTEEELNRYRSISV